MDFDVDHLYPRRLGQLRGEIECVIIRLRATQLPDKPASLVHAIQHVLDMETLFKAWEDEDNRRLGLCIPSPKTRVG